MFPTGIAPVVRVIMHAARARARAAGTPILVYLHDTLRNLSEDDVENLFTDRSLALTVSDATVTETERPLREKALSRCLSLISLSPSAFDLPFAERLFYPYIESDALTKLEKGEFAIALAIDSVRSRPFFAQALPLAERRGGSHQDLIAASRDRYTTPRSRDEVDQLFKKKDEGEENQKPKGKGGDTGSFSDTFRSIFSKKASTSPAQPGIGGTANDAAQALTGASAKPPSRKEPPLPKPTEIPEDELKRMLYVTPVGA